MKNTKKCDFIKCKFNHFLPGTKTAIKVGDGVKITLTPIVSAGIFNNNQ